MLSPFTALPTLLGPRTLITHGLQRLMGCILPTMHCRPHTTTNTHATTPNIVGATTLGVVASVCMRLTRKKRALSISPIQGTLHLLFAISVDLK